MGSHRLWVLLGLAGLACGGAPAAPSSSDDDAAAADWRDAAAAPADAGLDADGRRWIPGDLHMHVSPPDHDGVELSVDQLDVLGAERGLEFMVLTPHLHPRHWEAPAKRRERVAAWRRFAAQAEAAAAVTMIPGVEWTTGGGHFGVSGVDLGALDGDDFLAAADRADALIIVNHPFMLPTNIPGIRASRWDLSYKPWTRDRRGFDRFDGVEVWNVPLGLANLISRPGGDTGEARAFAAADRVARAERRPVIAVGGTDNHAQMVEPTTWVLAADRSAPSIMAALRAGATCMGGPEAGTLRARGDADPADRWARIGERVAAAERVELRWDGVAQLWVDGVDRGEHDGGWVHTGVGAEPHTYRIVVEHSRCGFIYANL